MIYTALYNKEACLLESPFCEENVAFVTEWECFNLKEGVFWRKKKVDVVLQGEGEWNERKCSVPSPQTHKIKPEWK